MSHIRAITSTKTRQDEGRTITTVIASTSLSARDGDVWAQDWQLDNYRLNPVVVDSHNTWSTSSVVGRAEVRVEGTEHGDALVADITWDESDDNPDGRRIARQFREGFLSAVSVGMRPGNMQPRSMLSPDHPAYSERGYYMTRNELLEISPVVLPADPKATKRSLADEAGDIKPALLHLLRSDPDVRRALTALPLSLPVHTPRSLDGDWIAALPEVDPGLAALFSSTGDTDHE